MTGYNTITPKCELLKCGECNGITAWAEGDHLHEGECEHYCHKKHDDRDVIGFEKYTTHSSDKELQSPIYRLKCECGNNTFYIQEVDTSCPGCGSGPWTYQVCIKCNKPFDE